MTVVKLDQPDRVVTPVAQIGWRGILPVASLFFASIGLYIWLAPRGFEYTDEAYYLLNYIHWRDSIGLVSFFAAYFEWPFRILGQSVSNIRIFTLIVLLTSSAFFCRELFRYAVDLKKVEVKEFYIFLLAGMLASMYFFSFRGTLRAPSYDLAVLASMLVSTGILLRLAIQPGTGIKQYFLMVAYGFTLGVCGLSKATAGILLVFIHFIFFLKYIKEWKITNLIRLFVFVLTGVALNFAFLHWLHPEWINVLRRGVADTTADGGHGLMTLINGFRWQTQELAPKFVPWILSGWLIYYFVKKYRPQTSKHHLSILIVILISICSFALITYDLTKLRLPVLVLATLLIWKINLLTNQSKKKDYLDLGLLAMLFCLPYAYSFGTDTGIFKQSQMAAVFIVTILLLNIYNLKQKNFISPTAMVACYTLLCVPPLVTQIRTFTTVEFTYRQLTPLSEQNNLVKVGPSNNSLLVDGMTHTSLESLIRSAKAAGMQPFEPILDFTDVGPGLTYVLQGKPLGTAWLIGGRPSSSGVSERLIQGLSKSAVKHAWILSSNNNRGAIKEWKKQIEAHIGESSHEYAGEATINIQTPNVHESTPLSVNIQFWRPINISNNSLSDT